MSSPDYQCLDAFIDPGHVGYDDDGILCQLVSVIMTDDTMRSDPAVCVLTAQEARELACELIVNAEHAERLTRQARSRR
jgi:hypothetical protein